jgi:hypothetical protein
MAKNSTSARAPTSAATVYGLMAVAPAIFGDRTKRTIFRSEALLAFAVLMTEQKVAKVSAPVAEKISDTFVGISGSA